MPVLVESVINPDSSDQSDLIKIHNDAPQWLTAGTPAAQWLQATLAHPGLQLYAGRFNDRLLGAATISKTESLWVLEWLCVRRLTRGRGVGHRLVCELERLAAIASSTLTVRADIQGTLPIYLTSL